MYYVITKTGVHVGKRLSDFNGIGKFDEEEFFQKGKDKILSLSDEDISFVKDKQSLSRIPMQNLYREDKQAKFIPIATLVLSVIILLKG